MKYLKLWDIISVLSEIFGYVYKALSALVEIDADFHNLYKFTESLCMSYVDAVKYI